MRTVSFEIITFCRLVVESSIQSLKDAPLQSLQSPTMAAETGLPQHHRQ